VGFPQSLSELKAAIHQILQGLQWLHGHDFVHRDLRWNNIIKDGDDCIRIINFEHSGREGFVNFELSIWPTLDNGCYTERVDIYLLRMMALEVLSKFRLGGEVQDFCDSLNQIDTAAEALSHSWLKD
jgi:serine/threonine protein kinase